MKTMYFKNTLITSNNAAYIQCEKPSHSDDFIVKVVNIPDDINESTVLSLINKTSIFKADVIDFSNLGEGKLVNCWGGRREGAGRPSTGRKKRTFYITDNEYDILKNTLDMFRK